MQNLIDDMVASHSSFTADADKTILIVDDEPIVADALAMVFREKGYKTMLAYDGESAVGVSRVTPPDILLTDVVMPGMDGIRLARHFHQHLPATRIVLLSGIAGCASIDLGFEATVLAKPIYPAQLIREIEQA